MDLFELDRFNPWWKTGKVRAELLMPFHRNLFFELEKFLPLRQMILIQGLRRTGKSTLLFQLIDDLLKKHDSSQVLYFSFDESVFGFRDVLECYQKNILGKSFNDFDKPIFLFLDEIQKVDDWENKLKVYYDLYPKIKIFVSGSASVSLRRKSNESLAGRIFDFTLDTLSFDEFLQLNSKPLNDILARPKLWDRDILPLFYRFLKFGSFPELALEENEELARKYILQNVVERIIYKDLPEEFGLKDLELLKALVFLLGQKPGQLINYHALSKNLHRDQRTIANYIEFLEFGLLVKLVFNYRGSRLASMRKLKKVYLSSPNIAFALNSNPESILPFLLENLVLVKTNAKFFYRNHFEVDFVLPEDDLLTAIEVKSSDVKTKQLEHFNHAFPGKVKKMVIVDFESEGLQGDIQIISAWKFLLFWPKS